MRDSIHRGLSNRINRIANSNEKEQKNVYIIEVSDDSYFITQVAYQHGIIGNFTEKQFKRWYDKTAKMEPHSVFILDDIDVSN